jgi:peptidoglycan/xylan/chitin deacetylase (PgdA/CDA1 family)
MPQMHSGQRETAMSKPIASLSLDLDNKWSYMKTHGDAGWDQYPSYLDIVVPRFLKFFEQRNLKITVFIVGQDAALEKNHQALASITAAGHEVGNHSFKHEPWLHLYTEQQIHDELGQTEELLQRICGERPVGFRGPGFSCSDTVFRVLKDRNYQYDCSTFPTFLGPLARMYYFMTAKLDDKQKQERKQLFGKLSEGFKPLKPFIMNTQSGRLLEIPVTTMPVFKLPIHISYILYLGQFSTLLAKTYFNMAITMCRLTATAPSILLHPLDYMGCDDDSDLGFFPAMRQTSIPKVELVGWCIDRLATHYTLTPMREHAKAVTQQLGDVQIREAVAV